MEQLIFCLEAGFPYPIITALLALADDDISIDEAWAVWTDSDYWPAACRMDHLRDEFVRAVEGVTEVVYIRCSDCDQWADRDNATMLAREEWVCDGGCLGDYFCCARCDEYYHYEDANTASDADSTWCETCIGMACSWCETCEEWTHYGHDHEEEDCDCEAPHKRFLFPANGHGTIRNDERLVVELPGGTIDDAGLLAIRVLLFENTKAPNFPYGKRDSVNKAMEAVGDQWQGKRGNYTKRMSRELHANHGIKIEKGVLSEMGNLAREHSSDTTTWAIEFTRNLNLPAQDFCHGESCWWGGYHESRCALKHWGGLGLRMFDEDDNPIGRAWVQPLDKDMAPTHDTINAHAYVIYNQYGALGGAKTARIIAHLTSRTYKKIGLDLTPQYVNGNSGWLVADEATCVDIGGIDNDYDAHDRQDADTLNLTIITADQEVAA